MGYDRDKLKHYQEREEEIGPRGVTIPDGLYHFAVDAEKSEVLDPQGFPRLRLTAVVLAGEQKNRQFSEFVGWYANPNPTKPTDKSFEERTTLTRRITQRWFQDLLDGMSGSPVATEKVGKSLDDAIHALQGLDDPTAVTEMMEAIIAVSDGVDFYGKVVTKKGTDYNNMYVQRDYAKAASVLGEVPLEL